MHKAYTRPNFTPIEIKALSNGLTVPQVRSLSAFPRVMGIRDQDWFAYLGIGLADWHRITVGGMCPKDIPALPAKLAEVINLVRMLADEHGGTLQAQAWLCESVDGKPSPAQRFVTDRDYRYILLESLGGIPHEQLLVEPDESKEAKDEEAAKVAEMVDLFRARLKVSPPGFRSRDFKVMMEEVGFNPRGQSSKAMVELAKKLKQLNQMLTEVFSYQHNAISWMQIPNKALNNMAPASYFTMMSGSREKVFDALDKDRGGVVFLSAAKS